jgi:hypothetical protein
MAIIKQDDAPHSGNSVMGVLGSFVHPNQFASLNKKQGKAWIKENMDYWSSIAYQQYIANEETIKKNYELLNGEFDFQDYVDDEQYREMSDLLMSDAEVPTYLKHYPILNPPVNTLLGELTKRPDNARVKALDEESKSEYMAHQTELLMGYISQQVAAKVEEQLLKQGVDISTPEGDEAFQKLTAEQIATKIKSYTTVAEQWGNKAISVLKHYFNLKDKSEEGFKDLLVCSREFHHIYPDKSRFGFSYKTENPRNVWFLGHANAKYTTDCYAVGTIEYLNISDILARYNLTKEETDHLIKNTTDNIPSLGFKSSFDIKATGIDSIHYNTVPPNFEQLKVEQHAKMIEGELGVTNQGYQTYNNYIVVRAYWQSKRKIGKLDYLDESGYMQSKLVDETYIFDEDSGDLNIEWTYENQWYQGTKIGAEIYLDVKPLDFNNTCPIIGLVHNARNSKPKSLVDLMKPYQILYNICINQLYQLLEKEIGVVVLTSLRTIPSIKDGSGEDAIEMWEAQARQRGVIFVDDSPENTKGPSQFNQHTQVDLSRSNEIQSRIALAQALKLECWELIGINRQRLGQPTSTETATGTNTALTQSYAQTEPLFAAHEYLMREVYQAMLNVYQYIELQKPTSTINYLSTDEENIFFTINRQDLLRDLFVFATNSSEDNRLFQELRLLAQPALQNGADFLDVIELYSTQSERKIKDIFGELKKRRQEQEERMAQIEEAKIQQAQEQFEQQMAIEEQHRQEDIANENFQNELDRINKKEVAIINSFSRQDDNMKDSDNNGVPDVLEASRLALDINKANMDYLNAEKQAKDAKEKDKKEADMKLQQLALEKEKIKADLKKAQLDAKVKRENMKNDKDIAKINAKNRNKPTKK